MRFAWSACLVCVAILLTSTVICASETVLLDDSFGGATLDGAKWSGPTPFGDVEGFVTSNSSSSSTTISSDRLTFGVTGSPFGGDDGVGILSVLVVPFPTAGTRLTITGELAAGTTGPLATDRQWWTGVGFYRNNENFFYLTARKEFGESEITYVSDRFEFGGRTIDDHATSAAIPETFSIQIEHTGLLTLTAAGLSTTLSIDPDNFPSLRVFAAAVARNDGDTMTGQWDRIKLVRTVPEPSTFAILAMIAVTFRSRRRR